MAEQRKIDALDYLIHRKQASKSAPLQGQVSGGPSASLEAFVAASVLKTLQRIGAADKGVRLADVGSELKMSAEVLVPLTRRLVDAGLVSVSEEDSFGNHLVRLTSSGAKLRDASPDEVRGLLG